MNEAIRLEIEALRSLKTKALKQRYCELFGEPSPSSNWAHLFRRVAWRLQANATTGLNQEARQRAAELAVDADLRLRAPRGFWRELDSNTNLPRDPRLPPAGTELTRAYRGRTVRVTVLEQGFEYKGKRFESLSSIASQVTGTRWNGFCFFGLNARAGNG
jgi:Protein of unknown function (DUF2924)